ncbi:unnamed protein product [Merluccius merluccius]
MLFTEYSSAFNTMVPSKLIVKLRGLPIGSHPRTCPGPVSIIVKAARQRLFFLRRLRRFSVAVQGTLQPLVTHHGQPPDRLCGSCIRTLAARLYKGW